MNCPLRDNVTNPNMKNGQMTKLKKNLKSSSIKAGKP